MKKLVILTGAGMSAESGISTFRDSDGLWENYNVEDVASIDGFNRNPELVLNFYNDRRKQLLECKPNAGHLGLVDLEKYFDVQIITQNVDNLHEKAGSTKVLHLHGELMKSCPVGNTSKVYDISPENPIIKLGDKNPEGKQLRPFIVWFGEAVPLINDAAAMVEKSDILVVIGTSLQVYPAAGLIHYATKNQPIYLIDPKPVTTGLSQVQVIKAGASEGVKKLNELLQSKV